MQTSVRELKAHLRHLLKRVIAGETVTVRVPNKPAAEIVPIRKNRSAKQLATGPGMAWNGKKPGGVARPEALPKDVSVSAWVVEDRR
jgi:prevent-host-death family protein